MYRNPFASLGVQRWFHYCCTYSRYQRSGWILACGTWAMARWGALGAEALQWGWKRRQIQDISKQAGYNWYNLRFFPFWAEKQDILLANDVDYIKVAHRCAWTMARHARWYLDETQRKWLCLPLRESSLIRNLINPTNHAFWTKGMEERSVVLSWNKSPEMNQADGGFGDVGFALMVFTDCKIWIQIMTFDMHSLWRRSFAGVVLIAA